MHSRIFQLFLGQYHIWLANDGFGVHVLVPGYPALNACVTTFTFICVIHEVKQCCTVLAELLVTEDVRVMFRRLLIFILFLGVIWWHKTHERKPTYWSCKNTQRTLSEIVNWGRMNLYSIDAYDVILNNE